jgi:RNA-splicing ligase RtcB
MHIYRHFRHEISSNWWLCETIFGKGGRGSIKARKGQKGAPKKDKAVVDVVHQAYLAHKVARLRPVLAIKG